MIYMIRFLRYLLFLPIAFTYILLGVDNLLEGAELYLGGKKS
jgi:hypothetical protein